MEITVEELRGLTTGTGGSDDSLLAGLVGHNVLIRSVTHYHVGRVVAFDDTLIRLADASWVPDTGRLSTALETGALSEVERFRDDCYVSRGAGVDITLWRHLLPTVSK